jgi:hypothetical protein
MSTPGLTGLAVPLPELETEHVTASADPLADEPFVGRAAELAELDRQFAQAAAGQGRVVVLAGPAGAGAPAEQRISGAWAVLAAEAGKASAAPPPATSAPPACCSPGCAPSPSWPAASRNSAPSRRPSPDRTGRP